MQKWLLFGWLLLRWLLFWWLLLRWLFLGWLLLPFSICKTPLGEIGSLGNACFLLTGYLSIQFFGSPPFLTQSVRLPLATHSLCSNCITYGTPCHARGHRHCPPTLYRECYGFERAFFYSQAFFTLHSFLLLSRPPWDRQFTLKGSRASCWSSKHSPGPTIVLNYSNPQEVYW